jgi:tRNA modification GTPase
MRTPDTIAAIATAPGSGGIGVVRISGPACRKIAQEILDACPPPRHASYMAFKDADGSLIDRGIAIFFSAPLSYTGEDVLELQGHGGTALMRLLLKRCHECGARQAEPGEFTRRAYLNGKLDLAQAEAVADVITAATAEAARSALRSLEGEFSRRIYAMRDKLIDLRMYVEACLDFPEEDIDFIERGNVAEKLAAVSRELEGVFAGARQGSLLREGIHIVLIGQPNVGKSTLMNQLAGDEVAIVTPVAGTTRDTIRSTIQIGGVPLHVIDTAGLRETEDEIELHGIARTWKAAERAHVALILVDADLGITEVEKSILDRLPKSVRWIWVHNKIDIGKTRPAIIEKSGETHLYLSAKSGEGLDLLRSLLLKAAGWLASGEGAYMARERHLLALQRVRSCLQCAFATLEQPELLAEELRAGQEALNAITGEFTPDELLGEIFGRFCIGK